MTTMATTSDASVSFEEADTRSDEMHSTIEQWIDELVAGVDFANLASAALAQSMERFVRRRGRRRGVRLLLTFVRADFDGSMIKALRDRGWHCTGKTEPGQAGNRPDKQIREQPKWRFLCEVPAASDREQTSLGRWSP
jgi:hypothetical protein